MRIIICDDDKFITSVLHDYICDFFDAEKQTSLEITIYFNGNDLLNDTGAKDIIFLDIEMPGINGIEIGNRLSIDHPDTLIFVITSHMEYLDDAMRFHVFRYLSKPIDKSRLFRNLYDAVSVINRRTCIMNKRINICTDRVNIELPLTNIACIESMKHKTIIRTLNNEYYSSMTLTYWLKILPVEYFIQIHRSYIVNMQHISDYDRATVYLCDGKYKAFLTTRKYSYFKKAYLRFLERSR